MAKYDAWITEEGLIKLQGYARDGMVDREIAQAIGVSRQTLDKWRKKFPQVAAVLKAGKEVSDRKVENALFEKCVGKVVTLRKPMKIKQTEYDPKTGRKVREYEEIVEADQEEYVEPDVKAITFWLINRKPDKWKQKVEIEQKSEEMTGIIQIEAPLDEDMLEGEYIEIESTD